MSPAATSSEASHFKKIKHCTSDFSVDSFTQYESTRTGMRVVAVNHEGPKVSGYFTLATEIHDDSGAPHTLEHLCFMGSRSYENKGILAKLTNRAYSDMNAWTATDHTAYTLESAGWDGFAQILPVYLEHVILPTLTDAACYTEVWHVDGEGKDAGVVYSEMQDLQNDQFEIMYLKTKRLLYPEGCGWRYETGGMLEHLRILTNERIRAFHKSMYQPKNMCVIVFGAFDHGDLLRVLDKFEESISDAVPSLDAPFSRPWITSKPALPLEKTFVEIVEFPEEDESVGEIMISFLGPSLLNKIQTTAFHVLLRYLSGSSASVLDKLLVEKESLASDVGFSIEDRPVEMVQFSMTSVATPKLAEVEQRFFEILKETASRPLDMAFMHDRISLERRQLKSGAESSDTFFSDSVIADYLYGNRDGSTLEEDVHAMEIMDELMKWSDDEWRHWLRAWFSDAHHVSILGKPSAALSEKLKSDEKTRIADRKQTIGESGLRDLAKQLEQATEENEQPVPTDIFDHFPLPSTDSIRFINTTSARYGTARGDKPLDNPVQKMIDAEHSDLPLFIHFEDVQSSFVEIGIIVSTEKVPVSLRPLLTTYLALFFTSPLNENGKRVEFEDVVKDLDRDTVWYSFDFGDSLGCSEALALRIKVEVEQYKTAITWLRRLMFSSVFDVERLLSNVKRQLSAIPDEKRSGSQMQQAINGMITAKPESISRAQNALVRSLYLKAVKKTLGAEPEKIIDQMEEIRRALWQPSSFRVVVIADVSKLEKPVGTWQSLTDGLDSYGRLEPLATRLSRLSELGRKPGNTALIVPLPTIDSSFALATAKGPSSHADPALPALLVAASYLNAFEGPLWVATRGTGLAYGVSIVQARSAGQVSLSIYRSPDAFKAYSASKQVVEDYASGKTPIDRLTLEGAVSGIVLNFANAEATAPLAALSSFIRQVVRDLDKDWPSKILEKVRKVSAEEVQKAMRDIILPIFDPAKSILVVTCAPGTSESNVEGFKGLGLQPQVKTLADFEDSYGLEVDVAEDDEDDEEADEGDDHGEEGEYDSETDVDET